jgi:hypothetical protein
VNNLDLARLLLDRGADPNDAGDFDGIGPIGWATLHAQPGPVASDDRAPPGGDGFRRLDRRPRTCRGHDGGQIVFEGSPADLVKAKSTLTGQHLAAFVGTRSLAQ